MGAFWLIRITYFNEKEGEIQSMKENETAKFQRFGSFFILLLLGLGLVLPFLLSLLACLGHGEFRLDAFLTLSVVFMVIVWIFLIMLIGYGNLTALFVKRTAKGIDKLPYNFNSSFKGRGGILYIDVEHGMIGFISAYNPLKIQIFSASRLSKMRTIPSPWTGIRFVFYIDGKKISMPTLLTNKVVSTKSGIGAEAVSKADAFVELLEAAKSRAGRR